MGNGHSIPTNSIKNEFNCSHCNKAVKTLRNLNNHVLRDTRETIYKRRNAAIQASMFEVVLLTCL